MTAEGELTFRALTENSTDTIMRFDRQHRHLYVNPAVEGLTGLAPEKFIGKTHRELGFPEALCTLWAEALERTFEARAVNRVEFQLPTGAWIDWMLAPEIGADGVVVAVITSARDITLRKQAELALRESERTFRALTENSLDTIMRFDRQHRHLYVNPVVEKQTGIAPEKFLGKTHRELGFPEDLCALWGTALDKTFNEGTVGRIEFRLPGGTWIDWVLAPEVGANGVVDAVITSARDITALKETEERNAQRAAQLIREERRKRYVEQVIDAQENERRRIARELHDVTGQTLTGLLVGLRSLEDLALGADAKDSVVRLRQLTSRAMEEVANLARGLHPSVLDDFGLLEALGRLTAGMAGPELKIDLQVLGFDGQPRLPVPLETTLYRIAQEALTNVVKHAGARTASLVLDRRPSEVRLVIEDDGRGFDVATTLADARGLGLRSISERASLVRGRVEIESRPGGTAVFVRVPYSSALRAGPSA